jgi:flagellar biosynthesis/type III secretory pathway protein FliH
MNGFENRYRAQQELLKQQQKQLQEQQRMITEMQSLQRQQLLQQQLATAKLTGDKRSYEPSHLHSLIANVQNEVLGLDGGVDNKMADESTRPSPSVSSGQAR